VHRRLARRDLRSAPRSDLCERYPGDLRRTNPTDQLVRYGVGEQEMCVMLAFTDSRLTWGGGVLERRVGEEVSNDGETSFHEAPCQMIPYASR